MCKHFSTMCSAMCKYICIMCNTMCKTASQCAKFHIMGCANSELNLNANIPLYIAKCWIILQLKYYNFNDDAQEKWKWKTTMCKCAHCHFSQCANHFSTMCKRQKQGVWQCANCTLSKCQHVFVSQILPCYCCIVARSYVHLHCSPRGCRTVKEGLNRPIW